MFDVGGGELLLIVLAIIVLFGPQKLPEIAQLFGKGMKKIRDAQSQFNQQMNTIKSEINKNVDPNKDFASDFYKSRNSQLNIPYDRDVPEASPVADIVHDDQATEPAQDTTSERPEGSTAIDDTTIKNYNSSNPYGLNDNSPAG